MLKIKNAIYIIAVALIIITPLVKFDTKGTQLIENRFATKFPAWPTSFKDVHGFTAGIELWASDRIGFRNKIVYAYRKTMLSVFNQSPNKLVVLGKNGSAFLNAGNEVKASFLGNKLDSNKSIAAQTEVFKKNIQLLSTTKRKVLVLSVPQAPLFRYKQLPDYLQVQLPEELIDQHATLTAVNQWKTSHPDETEKFILYPYEEAKQLAKLTEVYPEKNFHWTVSPFTVTVASLITERFMRPVSAPLSLDDFDSCDRPSDIAHLVGVPFINRNSLCENSKFINQQELTYGSLSSLKKISKLTEPAIFANSLLNPTAQAGKILVIGDSFTSSLLLPLARNFKEVIWLDMMAVNRMATVDKKHTLAAEILEIAAVIPPETSSVYK